MGRVSEEGHMCNNTTITDGNNTVHVMIIMYQIYISAVQNEVTLNT